MYTPRKGTRLVHCLPIYSVHVAPSGSTFPSKALIMYLAFYKRNMCTSTLRICYYAVTTAGVNLLLITSVGLITVFTVIIKTPITVQGTVV